MRLKAFLNGSGVKIRDFDNPDRRVVAEMVRCGSFTLEQIEKTTELLVLLQRSKTILERSTLRTEPWGELYTQISSVLFRVEGLTGLNAGDVRDIVDCLMTIDQQYK